MIRSRFASTLTAFMVIAGCSPAFAQDYSVMTGQGAVLDSMNTAVAERAERKARRSKPAAANRQSDRVRASSDGQNTEIAKMCAIARSKLSRMTPAQAAVYRRSC